MSPAVSNPFVTLREALLLTGRSLRAIPRVPERLLDVTVQPIMFVLLFLYVFGSAIHTPIPYKEWLFPGIIGQSLAFGLIGTGTATASDMSEGVVDRFRSMPIGRLAILGGQVLGQMCEQLLGMAIVVGLGLAIGWRPDLTVGRGLALGGLIVLGLFAFTWAGVLFGMLVRSPDAVQGAGFTVIFPLSFMAGTFVPIDKMDLIPRSIADYDPISALVGSVRGLTTHVHTHGSPLLDHPEVAMVIWCLVLLAVCVPLALRRLTRVATA